MPCFHRPGGYCRYSKTTATGPFESPTPTLSQGPCVCPSAGMAPPCASRRARQRGEGEGGGRHGAALSSRSGRLLPALENKKTHRPGPLGSPTRAPSQRTCACQFADWLSRAIAEFGHGASLRTETGASAQRGRGRGQTAWRLRASATRPQIGTRPPFSGP